MAHRVGSPQYNDMVAIGDSGHWPSLDITAALRGLPFADRSDSQRMRIYRPMFFNSPGYAGHAQPRRSKGLPRLIFRASIGVRIYRRRSALSYLDANPISSPYQESAQSRKRSSRWKLLIPIDRTASEYQLADFSATVRFLVGLIDRFFFSGLTPFAMAFVGILRSAS